jgi:phosphocarrier protein FPr
LAEAAAELAHGVGASDLPILGVGGVGDDHATLGTDTTEIMAAIQGLDGSSGVLVLADLGGAVLAAQTAIELLDGLLQGPVRLLPAPLVEGAVAAAVQIGLGADLDQVAAEALDALTPKREQLLDDPQPAPPAAALPVAQDQRRDLGDEQIERLRIDAAHGLHARPAAALVRILSGFQVQARARRADGGDWVNASSLNRLMLLAIRRGEELELAIRGSETEACRAALREFAARLREQPAVAAADTEGRSTPENGAARGAGTQFDRSTQIEQRPSQGVRDQETRLFQGLGVSPGVSAAPIFAIADHRAPAPSAPPGPRPDPLPVGDTNRLLQPLRLARERLIKHIEAEADRAERQGHREIAEISRAHAGLLADPDLDADTAARLSRLDCDAEQAFQLAAAELGERYGSLDDPYLRARAADVAAVTRRLLTELTPGAAPTNELPKTPAILLLEELTPELALRLDPAWAKGIGAARGSATAHAAIIARGLGLPMLVGLDLEAEQLAELDGRPAILDADAGTLEIGPATGRIAEARARIARAEETRAAQRAMAQRPARLADGAPLPVLANVANAVDCRVAREAGAEGIGLIRTELAFADATLLRDEEAQVRLLGEMLALMAGLPATVRLLDLGADKPPAGLPRPPEANPFLGVRGVRLLLDPSCASLLDTHLRALLRAAHAHPLKLMIPMVAELAEIEAIGRALTLTHQRLQADGIDHAWPLPVGIMVETPAAALQARGLAGHCAFFSIGSNDLTQYVMAAERGSAVLSPLADALHPAVLAAIKATCDGARSLGIPVSLCGEIGADRLALPILVGLGVTALSTSASALAAVKAALSGLDPEQCRALAETALGLDSAAEVRAAARVAVPADRSARKPQLTQIDAD